MNSPAGRFSLVMQAVRATEATALAAAELIGRGDKRAADEGAAAAMHRALAEISVDGTIRIGEGAQGETRFLHVGERVGCGGPTVDVAVMALEGTTAVARGEANALSVVAIAGDGGFLNAPDIYMDKLAVDADLPADIVDIDESPDRNLKELARARRVEVRDLTVCILDRPRHARLISEVRATGARIKLISDGDISGVIASAWPSAGVDVYMGVGGAPHGVLAAAALACMGGQMQSRLVFRGGDDRRAAAECGITDEDRRYTAADLASGDVTFAATGVTTGAILQGVRLDRGVPVTHSLVLRAGRKKVRYIEAHHRIARRSPVDEA